MSATICSCLERGSFDLKFSVQEDHRLSLPSGPGSRASRTSWSKLKSQIFQDSHFSKGFYKIFNLEVFK